MGEVPAQLSPCMASPTAPLARRLGEEQATPNEPFRLMPYNSELVLEARLGDTWDSLYRFGLEPAPPADYEMGNWYASTYPGSPFYANLLVARPSPGRRATLFNRRLTIRDRDGSAARQVLAGIDDYREALVANVGLSPAEDELVGITAVLVADPERLLSVRIGDLRRGRPATDEMRRNRTSTS
jgi:N-hydroxyarylamine O-acetyltransferase